MKLLIKNLGPLKQAEFELGELTIICGYNNTGKTYATYAVFGFLSRWRRFLSIQIPDKNITELLTEGVTELNIQTFANDAQKILTDGCKLYTKALPKIFASSPKKFAESDFQVHLNTSDIQPVSTFERTISAMKSQLFSISKKQDKSEITISLLVEKEKIHLPNEIINRVIGDALKDILFSPLFPRPSIASAERTGAAIFRKELNFARNRLLEQMGMDKDIDPSEYLDKAYSDYALPVNENVEFTRHLEEISKSESYISKEYPMLLEEFSDIIGGNYIVTKNDELYFIPNSNKSLKLTMDESSSSVRSLLDIGFYLHHVAQPGDILMIDEPELNLHPENQRRIARLFSRLVDIGIKVFLTTHSDYIIKELNTLIMLKQDKEYLKKLSSDEGYKSEELISADKIQVYIAEKSLLKLDKDKRRKRYLTLIPANIDPELGIEARSFDTTIEEMNRIQEAIVWGDE
ncbi:MAG: AAA family ATPase [Euryarchaeota archaeon]|nr:AAA family ATPase [Euryarchaeota archaeon]